MRLIFAGASTVIAEYGVEIDPGELLVTTSFYSILLQPIPE